MSELTSLASAFSSNSTLPCATYTDFELGPFLYPHEDITFTEPNNIVSEEYCTPTNLDIHEPNINQYHDTMTFSPWISEQTDGGAALTDLTDYGFAFGTEQMVFGGLDALLEA